MDAAQRKDILSRYLDHSRRFEEAAARRGGQQSADVIPLQARLRELEKEPTMREIEVLQLISDGLVNREIGQRPFLSEETVKSHVRHLLAKLQARSRAQRSRSVQARLDRLNGRSSSQQLLATSTPVDKSLRRGMSTSAAPRRLRAAQLPDFPIPCNCGKGSESGERSEKTRSQVMHHAPVERGDGSRHDIPFRGTIKASEDNASGRYVTE